jgi:hypothetical protein
VQIADFKGDRVETGKDDLFAYLTMFFGTLQSRQIPWSRDDAVAVADGRFTLDLWPSSK